MINRADIKKFLPIGPIVGLTLVGLLLLSAILYYKAIKIQRFLEPALAVSQPRVDFAQNIKRLLVKEFGESGVEGVKFTSRSIFVQESVLSVSAHHAKKSETSIIERLGRVFLSALEDKNIRNHIDIIMVIERIRPEQKMKSNKNSRQNVRYKADLVINSLYVAEPRLEKDFNTYFVAAVIPSDIPENEGDWIEFRIIPSELVHIELLQRLHKYMR